MKYNKREIMTRAHVLYREAAGALSWPEVLHRAWQVAKAASINADRIAAAQAAAGVTEECNTWSGWQRAGFEVLHGSKALFQTVLIHASKGDGKTYKASFFSVSQVQAIQAA